MKEFLTRVPSVLIALVFVSIPLLRLQQVAGILICCSQGELDHNIRISAAEFINRKPQAATLSKSYRFTLIDNETYQSTADCSIYIHSWIYGLTLNIIIPCITPPKKFISCVKKEKQILIPILNHKECCDETR